MRIKPVIMAQNHSDQDFQVPRTRMIDPVSNLQFFFDTKKLMLLGHPGMCIPS